MGLPAMTTTHNVNLNHLPPSREGRGLGIGVVGAGFIVRDCHLPAYADAGFRVVGLASRSVEKARATAALTGVPRVYCNLEEMLDDPAVEVVDIAVPPSSSRRSSTASSSELTQCAEYSPKNPSLCRTRRPLAWSRPARAPAFYCR